MSTIKYDTRKEWGLKLKALRESRGWSQEVLAKKLNVSRTYYIAIEVGRTNVGYDTIINLAKAFKIPTSKLMSLRKKAEESNRQKDLSNPGTQQKKNAENG